MAEVETEAVVVDMVVEADAEVAAGNATKRHLELCIGPRSVDGAFLSPCREPQNGNPRYITHTNCIRIHLKGKLW